jgi:hypothetical protein
MKERFAEDKFGYYLDEEGWHNPEGRLLLWHPASPHEIPGIRYLSQKYLDEMEKKWQIQQ